MYNSDGMNRRLARRGAKRYLNGINKIIIPGPGKWVT